MRAASSGKATLDELAEAGQPRGIKGTQAYATDQSRHLVNTYWAVGPGG